MIRTIALTLICLAGLGAIAGAAMRSPSPLPEPFGPVVAKNKTDRLPVVVNEDVQKAAAGKTYVAYVPPADEVRSPSAETPPSATPAPPDLKPLKADPPRSAKVTKVHKSRQSVSRSSRVATADQSPKQVSAPAAKQDSAQPPNQESVLKECSSSGLDPLLRKLNLAPQCN
jgi:hypothetical protein